MRQPTSVASHARLSLSLCFAAWIMAAAQAWPAPLNRPEDPVILSGAPVAALQGADPADLVAFRYDAGWTQIPVQVDERDLINFDDVYDGDEDWGGGFERLGYTDPGTFTGPDSNPAFDSNDEIVFMARDTGLRALGPPEPSGVVPGSGLEVAIGDPLTSAFGFVYLFLRDGVALDPSAGQDYVDYEFVLISGDYKTTYGIDEGYNPEDSTITTAWYQRHFSDRWICDVLRIFAGGATGVDILDHHNNQYQPDFCDRTIDTFSEGEGAFIVNKDGPVRAIRSYVGANSGPRTQRDHFYYERREDIVTYLRVHPIPGVMDYLDYSAAATGMTYQSSEQGAPVIIDGEPDDVDSGELTWELVKGPQGSLIILHWLVTDQDDLDVTSFYDDEDPSDLDQCVGDDAAFGASGPWVLDLILNTDPEFPLPLYHLSSRRIHYYDAPGKTRAEAQARLLRQTAPLVSATQPWTAEAYNAAPGWRAYK